MLFLPAMLALASCAPSPAPPPRLSTSGPIERDLIPSPDAPGDPNNGQRLFTQARPGYQSGCGTCHTLSGVSSGVWPGAPNLTNVTLRPTLSREGMQTNPDNLRRWIMDPRSMKSDATMPALAGLSEEDARDLTAFLYSQPYNPIR